MSRMRETWIEEGARALLRWRDASQVAQQEEAELRQTFDWQKLLKLQRTLRHEQRRRLLQALEARLEQSHPEQNRALGDPT
jgi:DNA-binding transcriptional regulator YbjK